MWMSELCASGALISYTCKMSSGYEMSIFDLYAYILCLYGKPMCCECYVNCVEGHHLCAECTYFWQLVICPIVCLGASVPTQCTYTWLQAKVYLYDGMIWAISPS